MDKANQHPITGEAASESSPAQLHLEEPQQFWTEHRTTLISYETQFVNGLKPQSFDEQQEAKRSKSKKKNIEYEGGFLFPGRAGDKDTDISSAILTSKFHTLRVLFEAGGDLPRQQVKLRQFVLIMLELKHSIILRQFLEIYDLILREIKEVKFESIRVQADRFEVVEDIANKVTNLVLQCPYLFGQFTKYIQNNQKETTKLFKVTTYCFLAEVHEFSLNEYYCEAFDIQELQEGEGRLPRKRKKVALESQSGS